MIMNCRLTILTYIILALKIERNAVYGEICTKNVCEYKFVVRETRSMMFTTRKSSGLRVSYPVKISRNGSLSLSPNTRNVPDVSVPVSEVHTADGHTRTITTINDQFPGPAIEVTEGAQVSRSIGFECCQKSCCECSKRNAGIKSYNSFSWNAHETQPMDGWNGVYFSVSSASEGYIFDGTETSPLGYWSGLINGRGRHSNNTAPLSVFKVKAGQKYRIHLIFSSMEYNYRFSIDQHELTVVEADGYPVKPVQVESLLGFMGERFVVEFTANKTVKNYWIRAKMIRTGLGKNPQPDGRNEETLAILEYEGADGGEPETSPTNCTESKPCRVLNCPWTHYHKEWYPNRQCIPISDLRLDKNIYDAKVDTYTPNNQIFEIFLNFGFLFGSSINKHRNVLPRAPLFQESGSWGAKPCSSKCYDRGCVCTYVIDLPHDRTIQMVLTSNTLKGTEKNGTISDIGDTMHHPVHIHGHSFQVLKVGFPIANPQTGRIEKQNPDVVCENEACSKQRWADGQASGLNFDNPPMKDTVNVPAFGYVVIRFKSDNPGYWFLHCHQLLHYVEGMSLILNESHAHLPPPPPNFPTCKDFSMDSRDFVLMLERNKQNFSKEFGLKEGSTSKASRAVFVWAWTFPIAGVAAFLTIHRNFYFTI